MKLSAINPRDVEDRSSIMRDMLFGFVGSKEVPDCARGGKHINPSGFTEISS